MTSEGKPVLGKGDIRTLSQHLDEGAGALNERLAALPAYRDRELPTRVDPLWRFTNPLNLLPTEPMPANMPPRDVAAAELPADEPAVLLVPGRAPVLNEAAAALGLTVAPLHDDAQDAEKLGVVASGRTGLFASLNAVAWNAGLTVRVPRGVRLDMPLRLLVPAFAETTLPRVLVDVGESADVTVVEEHFGGAEGHRVVGMTEIMVGPNAHAKHVLVQRWAEGVHGWLSVQARVERDGSYQLAGASLGGTRSKLELGADLAGPGARSEMAGVVLGGERQFFDHHTSHRHLSGRTWSNIDFKTALADRARSSYTGLIRIEEDAASSEAFQENRNLLLSGTARADSIPELEILTDDVSCSHGATAGPIDPEQVFYLQSRGIPRDAATRLVVQGFLESTLDMMPAAVRANLDAMVSERLDRLDTSA
jgi:Fe-S cluster assembly protein SufD